MPSFAFDPFIRLRHRRFPLLRSTADGVALARSMAADKDENGDWAALLRSLERVKSEEEALEVAVALESVLERESLLIEDTTPQPAMVPRVPKAQPPMVPSRAMSMVFATARAEPDR
jgi:hypothetical protein